MGNSVQRALSNYGENESQERLLKVEAFRWSSEEYSEEYAVTYTRISDGLSTCVLRVSANPEKARVSINDGLCLDEEVSMAVEVAAAKDNSGKYTLGPRRIGCSHGIKLPTGHGKVPFEYGCDKRKALVYVDIERCNESNFWLELLRVDHSLYFADDKGPLEFSMKFKFHRSKGLLLELDGPSYNGKLCIDRTEEGNPDYHNNYSIVKTKFLFPSKDSIRVRASSVLSATGAINNVNSRTEGWYDNSIFNNCTINEASKQ